MKSRNPDTKAGRPRSFDEQQVLLAAMRAFWEYGFEGTSVSALERATGLKAPSLYGAFGSKLDLYYACLENYTRTYGHVLRDDLPVREAFAEFLLQAARTFSDRAHPPGCMISTAALNLGPGHRSVADRARDLRMATLKSFTARLTRAVSEGELPADTKVDALARLMGATVQGMSVQALDGASLTELEGLAEFAMHSWPTLDR